jgi:hypothetical protein
MPLGGEGEKMSTKAELLNQLALLGIPTPNTWNGSLAEDLAAQKWQPDSRFYCRAEATQEKITMVTHGYSLLGELAKAAPPTTRWAIQPLYDFDISGALFFSDEVDYLESVWGSAIGLLRDGLLAYREYRSLNGTNSKSWLLEQDYQLRYFGPELARRPINLNGSHAAEDLSQRPQVLMSLLKSHGILGLFEWGSSPESAFILDWKPFLTGYEFMTRVVRLVSQEPRADLMADHVRPNLYEIKTPLPARSVFDHGARLSHLVTRSLADYDCEVLFCH